MKSRLTSYLAGLSLALCLQTAYRSTSGIGLGELLMAACLFLFSMPQKYMPYENARWLGSYVGISLLLVTLVVVVPSTIVFEYLSDSAYGDESRAVREIIAYIFAALFTVGVSTRHRDLSTVSTVFLWALIILLLYHYTQPNQNSFYHQRFTGGAKNPNQLALYLATAPIFCLSSSFAQSLKIGLGALLAFFAYATQSEALMAAGAIGSLAAIVARYIPHRQILPATCLLGISLPLALTFTGPSIKAHLLDIWTAADQGQSRLTLMAYGLNAWLDSPWSILFGNGGGAFSGLTAPFQGEESHNGIVDVLTISGLTGLVAVNFVPIRTAYLAYKQGRYVLFGALVGLVSFGMFHFVLRQPVFWVAFVVAAKTLFDENLSARARKPVLLASRVDTSANPCSAVAATNFPRARLHWDVPVTLATGRRPTLLRPADAPLESCA